MPVEILFAGPARSWDDYRDHLPRALRAAGVDARVRSEIGDPRTVDYIVYAPGGPVGDFGPFVNTKAVLSLWAGVERIATEPTLTQPLARMVDPGLTRGMVEWVTGHVLRHHLGIDRAVLHQDGVWREDVVPPLASARPVGMLGLGVLGAACARTLAALGFPVEGWSRRPKRIEGVGCRSGEDGLRAVLERSGILVLLLPLTGATENLMNAERLGWLPEGAILINPGRGPLIDDAALLATLDAGHLGHATLDVFREEPLPPDHPFWAHPKITVTPHIASATRPETAVDCIAENIARGEAGLPFLHLVDRTEGY